MVYNAKIASWKKQGMICDDWNEILERYINSERCEECNNIFRKKVYRKDGSLKHNSNKVLDHDHKTGKVRNVICSSCNAKRRYIDANHWVGDVRVR